MYFFSYLEPVCCSMSSSNCCFLTCIQVSQEAGRVVWYSHLFQNFPQFIVIHTIKGSGIVTKAEIDVLKLSWFFHDPADVGNLISGSSTMILPRANCMGSCFPFLVKHFLQRHQAMFPIFHLNILWHCLSLGLEWKLTFSSPVATAEFSKFAGILSAALSQHHLSGFEIAPLEFHHLH